VVNTNSSASQSWKWQLIVNISLVIG